MPFTELEKEMTGQREKYQGPGFDQVRSDMPVARRCGNVQLAVGCVSLELCGEQGWRRKFRR